MNTNRNHVRIDQFGRFTRKNNCSGLHPVHSIKPSQSLLLTKLVLSDNGGTINLNKMRQI